ncbi:hypothetical protein BDB00DRAFT_796793 [Zychaea mexicana]|uniref:uncharacterized protein n=1 Tax=Zychaea mexicana TaxID=64656 RepID=UPI0022FDF655|nr:uncharacterized protein BDB00DRAFT_796793 [Zychaea mexicana]KAI9499416.1 hypothetical protein BDB00DRAFT_796793 [Zychaea mexicana]
MSAQQTSEHHAATTISLKRKVSTADENGDKSSLHSHNSKNTNDKSNAPANGSTATATTAKKKKARSASIDSKASKSWFWRSSTQQQQQPTIQEQLQSDNNSNAGPSDSNNNASTNLGSSSSGGGGGDSNNNGGNDDNDNSNNNEDNKEKDNEPKESSSQQPGGAAVSGIWSWLGYSNTNGPVEQKPDVKDDDNVALPPAFKTEETTTAPPPPQQKESAETSTLPSAQTDAQHNNNTNNTENRTYWKSFFWSSEPDPSYNGSNSGSSSNNNNQDSVVIEKLSSTETRTDAPSPAAPIIPQSNKKNVVVPTIESQLYPPPETPNNSTSLLNKALRAINHMFAQKSPQHVNTKFSQFVRDMKAHPEDIAGKKFVIVGVHGWFPTKLVRSVLGEPTGTSIKFCEQMVSGVRHYFQENHGLVIPHHAITSIPLEGEGKVEERVDRLHKALLGHPGWMDALTTADIVLWTTHSQGTPVSTMMLHRLLEEKHINLRSQSVCLLAMAGISHGPFPSLKGNLIVKYFEADAARELFHFMDSSSEISQKYRESLNYLLRSGIKTVLVGSMQDQVVPLYSAIMTGASHPNILRAVYIDGHIYSDDDFLINLVTFALRLRNAGLSDHGLLTHISEVLAGDLYSWEGGHSTIYEERDVFIMAVQYLFESASFGRTTRTTDTAVDVLLDRFQARVRQNPFYLPWAMRGICDDAAVLSDQILRQELQKLRTLFEQWVPASAKLREIKFRLEPLRARL